MKLISAIAMSMMIVASTCAIANDVVEVRMVEVPRQAAPSTKPSAELPDAPKDGKLLLSIETLADSAGDFNATSAIGGHTLQLKGQVKLSANGKRQLKITFFSLNPPSSQGLETNVDLGKNEAKVIGAFEGSRNTSKLIVVTIKPDPRTVTRKAE